jgi:hypothetical protein
MNSVANKLASTNQSLRGALVTLLMGLGLFALATSVQAGAAGVVTIFDSLATNTDAAIFGPLGQTIIAGGAAAGGIFAILKGMWMLAGLGIAIAALMFGAQLVANSSGFGALI